MSRAVTSVHSLVWREMRRNTVVVAVLVVLIIETGLKSFNASGGAAGMVGLAPLLANPAVAALYGRVDNLNTGGAFVVWKMGAVLVMTVAIWAALSATRLTRAHEDDGNWDVLVIGRRNRDTVLRTTTLVLAEMGLVAAAASGLMMRAGGQSTSGSLYYALGMLSIAWSGAIIGLLSAQIAAPRRAASQLALALVVLAFLLRVVADAGSSLEWMRDLTFFGWVEKIGAFQTVDAGAAVPALVGPLVAVAAVWWLQDRRDVGGALYTHADSATAKPAFLSSPWLFAWRERSSVWRWWTLGLAVFGVIMGYLTHALVSLAHSDPSYTALLNHWGMGAMVTGVGFVAIAATVMSVVFTLLVVSWISSTGADEVKGRLDLVLATGVSRSTWMFAVTAGSLACVVVAGAATTLALWGGVRLSGTAMALSTVAEAVAGSLALVPFMVGLSVWLVARFPRLAFALGAMLVIVAYVAQILGPVLRWPALVLEVNPFHYLRSVPVSPFDLGGFLGVTLVGAAIGAAGLWRYTRRDVAN